MSDYYDTNGDGYAETIASDTNGDGIEDALMVDTDSDGYIDTYAWDTNGDGAIDVIGVDANEDGIIEAAGWDTNGDGVMDTLAQDTNGDGQLEVTVQPGDGLYPSTATIGAPTWDGLGGLLNTMAGQTGDAAWGTESDWDADGTPDSSDRYPNDPSLR